MKYRNAIVPIVSLTLPLICLAQDSASTVEAIGGAPAPENKLRLWYRQPAAAWTEALPIGNGRLGAMVFGGVDQERFQLNEDTLWAGGPYDPSHTNALAALPEVRQLIFEGKYDEADRLTKRELMARPLGQMHTRRSEICCWIFHPLAPLKTIGAT